MYAFIWFLGIEGGGDAPPSWENVVKAQQFVSVGITRFLAHTSVAHTRIWIAHTQGRATCDLRRCTLFLHRAPWFRLSLAHKR